MSDELKTCILEEKGKGNIVFWGLPDELMSAPLDEFVEQPADGILYDLNRLEEVSMTFLSDRKWVNDYAVASVIRKLVEQRDEARAQVATLQAQVDAEGARMDWIESRTSTANNRPFDESWNHWLKIEWITCKEATMREAIDAKIAMQAERNCVAAKGEVKA